MKKLLVFQHVAREHPSRIAEYATERDIALDIVRLWESEAIPPVSSYDGLVVLGGPMGAYESFSWKENELAAIRDAIGTMPVLGLCLGAQLIAYALGARVYPAERDGKRLKEIGYYQVALAEEGKQSPLFRGFPETFDVLQWHGDTFDLPEGGTLLATAPLCPNQAFSYKDAYGLQFHVEMTEEVIREILEADREWTRADFVLDEEKLIADAVRFEPVMKEQCYRLMDNFLA